jgi:hypothetical protein
MAPIAEGGEGLFAGALCRYQLVTASKGPAPKAPAKASPDDSRPEEIRELS